MNTSRLRSLVPLLAACAAAVVASCETAPPPPPPPPPAPVELPPAPPIAVSGGVLREAAAYQQYMRSATAISPTFLNAQQVAQRVQTGAAFEPRQLARGAIAYGAVVALQDPTFVAAVRSFARDPEQRRQLAARLMSDPAYAVAFNGSASAAGLVVSALNTDARALMTTGRAVKQSAYDVQHQMWSRGDIADRPGRLNAAKAVSLQAITPATEATTALHAAATGSAPLTLSAPAVQPPYSPAVIRSLALAALAAMGEAEGVNLEAVEALMNETDGSGCLNFSKLNLFQCLSVAKPYYEDVFCLGQHILMDAAQCVGRMSGAPIDPPAAAPAVSTAQMTPVPVPAATQQPPATTPATVPTQPRS